MHDVIGILAGFMCLKYVKKSVLYRPAWEGVQRLYYKRTLKIRLDTPKIASPAKIV